ncbi:hypothetical protein FACS1894125_4790 [Actinomycetota bacterium]|nr:hypothetical protein FACS1894125_4790 [Actinomycetota bacterium]
MNSELEEIEYFVCIFKVLVNSGRLTRKELVELVLQKDRNLTVTNAQRAINSLLESKILDASFGELRIRPKYSKSVKVIIADSSDDELSHGYLHDLHTRERDISAGVPTKWVEFFLGLVSVIQIVPYIGESLSLSKEFDMISILTLGALCWILVFNRTLFNKHPILIPLDVQQKIRAEYDAEEYKENSAPQMARGKQLISLISQREGETVLDVGCGDGRITLELHNYLPKVKSLLGLDFSHSQIDSARKLFDANGLTVECGVNFAQGDFLTFNPKNADGYSLVFSNVAIHWIGPEAYTKIYELLHNGGRLVVEQCGKNDLIELARLRIRAVKELGLEYLFEGKEGVGHFYGPTQSDLDTLLKTIGYENVKVTAQEIVYDDKIDGIYKAFAASSLQPYYGIIGDVELNQKFKDKFLELCYREQVPAIARRLVVTASKGE